MSNLTPFPIPWSGRLIFSAGSEENPFPNSIVNAGIDTGAQKLPTMSNPETKPEPSSNITPTTPPSGLPSSEPAASPPPKVILFDAKGNLITDKQSKAPDYVVDPFPDGSVFRYAPNPAKAGTYVLIDKANNLVAAAVNLGVAQVLCEGARAFFIAAARNLAANKNENQ